MPSDPSSNAVLHDLESAYARHEDFTSDAPFAATGASAPDFAFVESAESFADDEATSRGSFRDVEDILAKFHTATEEQVKAHLELTKRLTRMADGESVVEMGQALRELHESLSGLTADTGRTIARMEGRIGAIAEALQALGENTTSSNSVFRHLCLSAHEKIAAAGEQTAATVSRMDQAEKNATELKAGETTLAASLAALSEKVESLQTALATEQAANAQLRERLVLAERTIGDLSQNMLQVGVLGDKVATCERGIAALSQSTEQLGGMNAEFRQWKVRLEKAESQVQSALDQSQTIARFQAKLAESFTLR